MKWRALLGMAAAVASLSACDSRNHDSGDPVASAPLFVAHASAETGLAFVHQSGGCGKKHLIEITTAGVALLDYDGDGDQDLFFAQGAPLPDTPEAARAGRDFRDRLFRNDGKQGGQFLFTDVTEASGVSDAGASLDDYTCAAACPDFDGDGDPDLYLCNVGKNRFLRNDGGHFVDVTDEWGGASSEWSTAAVFADFDRDGDLDLYVVNYVRENLDHPGCGPRERGPEFRSFCHPDEFPPADDALWRNDGWRLLDISAEVGLTQGTVGRGGAGLGAVFADVDGDGDRDLFVANDSTPSFLWRNDSVRTFPGGSLRLTEIGSTAGVAVAGDGLSTAAMGCDFGDTDGDGDFDLLVANLDFEPNSFFRNDGHGNFDDRSTASGLGPPSLRFVGFGCELFDADLDGDLDALVVNGHVLDNVHLLDSAQTFRQPPHFYRNDGRGRFAQIGAEAGDYFAGQYVGRGLAIGDLDNDGDADAVVAHWDQPPMVLENRTVDARIKDGGGAAPRWIGFELEGSGRNRQAIGARVEVRCGATRQVEEVRGTSSFGAFSDLRLLFGLPPDDGSGVGAIDALIRWPDGKATRHTGLERGRYHHLREE